MRPVVRGLTLSGLVLLISPLAAGEFKLEPGYTLLFNGKNLDGWKTKQGGQALDGKTEAYKGRFKVADGKIVIDYKMKGDMTIETAKELSKDVTIKFEFLPGDGCNNDLYFRGIKFDLVPKQLKGVKKDGEWNELEITSQGDVVEYRCNGMLERTTKGKGDKSAFGVRAELGVIEIRNMRIKEAK